MLATRLYGRVKSARIALLSSALVIRTATRAIRTRGVHANAIAARNLTTSHFGKTSAVQMRVITVPCLTDNYAYVLLDEHRCVGAVVDPVEPLRVLDAIRALGPVRIETILTTHHHWDHAGGNVEMVELLHREQGSDVNVRVVAGDERVAAVTRVVSHGETIEIGGITVSALHTPCHTRGSISFHATHMDEDCDTAVTTSSGAVFTGDTLFLGGCGRFFEGTAADMYHALIDVLATLPPTTAVYCGHEYTRANLKFALGVEPNNIALQSRARNVEARPITVPGTIAEELATNPFMRVRNPDVLAAMATTDPVEAMQRLRDAKNNMPT